MSPSAREIDDLERALVKRSLTDLGDEHERCGYCRRTPLIGERMYTYASGVTVCELCRTVQSDGPVSSRLIHGPEFGHTMRIHDRRAAA